MFIKIFLTRKSNLRNWPLHVLLRISTLNVLKIFVIIQKIKKIVWRCRSFCLKYEMKLRIRWKSPLEMRKHQLLESTHKQDHYQDVLNIPSLNLNWAELFADKKCKSFRHSACQIPPCRRRPNRRNFGRHSF